MSIFGPRSQNRDSAGPAGSSPGVSWKIPHVPGSILRNIRAILTLGVAVAMMLVVLLSSGTPKRKEVSQGATFPAPAASRSDVEQYRAQLDADARKLTEERQHAEKARHDAEAAARSAQAAQNNPAAFQSGMTGGAGSAGASAQPSPVQMERQLRVMERAARDEKSLSASNIALSFRNQPPVHSGIDTVASEGLPHSSVTMPPDPNGSSADVASLSESVAAGKPEGRDGFLVNAGAIRLQADNLATQRVAGKLYRLYEGTILETVLTNRLDGSFAGPVNAMITTDVFSPDDHTLLIPQGTRVLGQVERVSSTGQQRLAIFFHRLLMPDGNSHSLDHFLALDQTGKTGLRDEVNHHYFQIFGTSLAIGAIAGTGQSAAGSGASATGADAYGRGVSESLSQSALHILDRFLNVLPTFTVREGTRIKISLTSDLVLPQFASRKVPAIP